MRQAYKADLQGSDFTHFEETSPFQMASKLGQGLPVILLNKGVNFEARQLRGFSFLPELYTKIGKIGKSIADFAPKSRIS